MQQGIDRVGSDMRLTWRTVGNTTNIVQLAGPNLSGGFSNLSSVFVPGTGNFIVESVDAGGATNSPARFYRIRLQPGASPCAP